MKAEVQRYPNPETIQDIATSLVKVNFCGTGFVFCFLDNNQRYSKGILTLRQFVNPSEKSYLSSNNGLYDILPFKEVQTKFEIVAAQIPDTSPLYQLPPLGIADTLTAPSKGFVVLQSNNGYKVNITSVRFSEKLFMIRTPDVIISKQNLGAPVLNQNREVVGILWDRYDHFDLIASTHSVMVNLTNKYHFRGFVEPIENIFQKIHIATSI